MWWQFKKVDPSIKLHLCHCVDVQLFVRVDRHKKSTNICLQGERMGNLLHHYNDTHTYMYMQHIRRHFICHRLHESTQQALT